MRIIRQIANPKNLIDGKFLLIKTRLREPRWRVAATRHAAKKKSKLTHLEQSQETGLGSIRARKTESEGNNLAKQIVEEHKSYESPTENGNQARRRRQRPLQPNLETRERSVTNNDEDTSELAGEASNVNGASLIQKAAAPTTSDGIRLRRVLVRDSIIKNLDNLDTGKSLDNLDTNKSQDEVGTMDGGQGDGTFGRRKRRRKAERSIWPTSVTVVVEKSGMISYTFPSKDFPGCGAEQKDGDHAKSTFKKSSSSRLNAPRGALSPPSEKSPPTPHDETRGKAAKRRDFGQFDRKGIPFEDAWFDDIKYEQPPALDQQRPDDDEHKYEGVVNDRALDTSNTSGSTTKPLQNKKLSDATSNAPIPSETCNKNPPHHAEDTKPLPTPKQIVYDTLTAPPVFSETPTEVVLRAIQKLSLRDELFPEESPTSRPKPPAPKQSQESSKELPHMPFKDSWRMLEEESWRVEEEPSQPGTVAVLRLETVSTALADDDFQRLTFKGKHIEEWRSAGGSVQVIPSRDPSTLAHRGAYYLLFPNADLAQTYRDQVQQVHSIARTFTPTSIESPMAPPPGMLVSGQNVHRLLQDFTLCPPGLELHLRLVPPPYPELVRRMLADGGVPAIDPPGRPRRSGRAVVFWLKWYPLTTTAVVEFLTHDGRERGLPWGPMDGRGSVEKLRKDVDGGDGFDEEEEEGVVGRDAERGKEPRWLISFEDEDEARRFVRTWHQRPWPGHVKEDVLHGYRDAVPLIQAEYLL